MSASTAATSVHTGAPTPAPKSSAVPKGQKGTKEGTNPKPVLPPADQASIAAQQAQVRVLPVEELKFFKVEEGGEIEFTTNGKRYVVECWGLEAYIDLPSPTKNSGMEIIKRDCQEEEDAIEVSLLTYYFNTDSVVEKLRHGEYVEGEIIDRPEDEVVSEYSRGEISIDGCINGNACKIFLDVTRENRMQREIADEYEDEFHYSVDHRPKRIIYNNGSLSSLSKLFIIGYTFGELRVSINNES